MSAPCRCILWARLAVLGAVVCHCIVMNLELDVPAATLTVPSLGVVRPAVGLVLAFLAFFVSSHQVFRWLVRGHPVAHARAAGGHASAADR